MSSRADQLTHGGPANLQPIAPDAAGGVTIAELKTALLAVGRAHPDAGDVMHAAYEILGELGSLRSEIRARASVGLGHLSQGNLAEAMRMFDSVERMAGAPDRRFQVLTTDAAGGER